jgi:hypothetical protein
MMALTPFWTWLEGLSISARIGESWWFPLLESIHVLTATFLVGSILMLDLRLLGVASRTERISRIATEIVPWTCGAAAVSIIAGVGMFMTRAGHYAGNPAFELKMGLLVAAGVNMAVFHFRTSRTIAAWDLAPVAPLPARVAGAVSLILWLGVLLAGRWVGHLS